MDNGAGAGRTTERTDREWLSWALQFAQANLKSWQESIHVPLMNAEIPFKGTCVFFVWGGQPEVRYRPTEKTVTKQLTIEMLVRTGELFLRGDLSQLRRCPGCQRWFLAARHRRFDTPECRMRHRIRLLNGRGRRGDLSPLAWPSWVTRRAAVLRSSNAALAAEGTLACADPAVTKS